MGKDVTEIIKNVVNKLPKNIQGTAEAKQGAGDGVGARKAFLTTTAAFENLKKFNVANDQQLTDAARELASFERMCPQTFSKSVDAQYYPKHNYIFTRTVLAIIAEHGLDHKTGKLNPKAQQWLLNSSVAKDLIYPDSVYTSSNLFETTGWVNFWEGNLVKRRFLAGLNDEIKQRDERNKRKSRQDALANICFQNKYDELEDGQRKPVDAAFRFLRDLHYGEEEAIIEESLAEILGNTDLDGDDFTQMAWAFDILKAENSADPFLRLDKFNFYAALHHRYCDPKIGRNNHELLINKFEGQAEIQKNLEHYHSAYEKALNTTNWQSKGMLLGGAAIGGEVAILVMEIVMNMTSYENWYMLPAATSAFLFFSVGMGYFFYYAHAQELFKAKLRENYNTLAGVPAEKSAVFTLKNLGTTSEGALAALGTMTSVFFVSDLITMAITGDEINGFIPGLQTAKHIPDFSWNGISYSFDLPSLAIAIVLATLVFIPAVYVGYSITNGHKTLDGPHCDEFQEEKKNEVKICSEIPTSATSEPLRFSTWQGVKHSVQREPSKGLVFSH